VLDDLEVFIPMLLEYEPWEILVDSFGRSGAPILGSAVLTVPPFNMIFSVCDSHYLFYGQSNKSKQRVCISENISNNNKKSSLTLHFVQLLWHSNCQMNTNLKAWNGLVSLSNHKGSQFKLLIQCFLCLGAA